MSATTTTSTSPVTSSGAAVQPVETKKKRGPGRPPREGPSTAPTMIAIRYSGLKTMIKVMIYDWTEAELNELIGHIRKQNEIRNMRALLAASAGNILPQAAPPL